MDVQHTWENVALLGEVPQAVAEYVAKNNVIHYDPRREVTMTSPAFGQAEQTVWEAVPGITSGTTDYMPVLERAEELITQAWEEQEE